MQIEEGEFVVGIEGFYGSLENGNSVIRSLTLITNKAKYGPKGDEIGTYEFCGLQSEGGWVSWPKWSLSQRHRRPHRVFLNFDLLIYFLLY